ncbi:MAG: hypothetical protein GY950_05825 [bacterium]|nr:hypothetical protein [bacterium]
MRRPANIKGNILMAILFVVMITFLGLGLLNFSIFHTWIRGARAYKITQTERMHQELIYYLHHFFWKVFNEDLREFPEPETDYFNNSCFPDIHGVNDDNIIIKNSFSYRISPKEYYKKVRVINAIDVSSGKNNYGLNAEVFVDMVTGQIPLTLFPFFMHKPIGIPEDIFLEENNVINGGTGNMVVDNMDIEFDTTGFLMNSLKIKGTALTWAAMREKFGFDVSNEPIPEGIHLLVEDGMAQCIFIQGDVDRLIFSIHDNIQKFIIVKNGTPHEYHYKPGEDYFICWDNQREEPFLFEERIVVNGNIWSLEQEGAAAFTENSDITLYASGSVVIRSDLETENFELKQMQSTSLTLVSSFEKLFGRDALTPAVTIDKKDETSVQVSLITDGKVNNKSSRLKVKGSIFCSDLENEGTIEITHHNSNTDSGGFFRTSEFKYIYHFFIHCIEEKGV